MVHLCRSVFFQSGEEKGLGQLIVSQLLLSQARQFEIDIGISLGEHHSGREVECLFKPKYDTLNCMKSGFSA